jgi:hypothetical protein
MTGQDKGVLFPETAKPRLVNLAPSINDDMNWIYKTLGSREISSFQIIYNESEPEPTHLNHYLQSLKSVLSQQQQQQFVDQLQDDPMPHYNKSLLTMMSKVSTAMVFHVEYSISESSNKDNIVAVGYLNSLGCTFAEGETSVPKGSCLITGFDFESGLVKGLDEFALQVFEKYCHSQTSATASTIVTTTTTRPLS